MPVWNTLPTNRDRVLLSSCLSYPTMCLYFITAMENGHTVLHNVSCVWRLSLLREQLVLGEKKRTVFIKVKGWCMRCHTPTCCKENNESVIKTPIYVTYFAEKGCTCGFWWQNNRAKSKEVFYYLHYLVKHCLSYITCLPASKNYLSL